ncbi:hypothetical protein RHMOL_Rhmol01G0095200 [Rhododendron molle]|uniref:Uncharacterized protein n=1 Tax=Rhododendron molle TaxID=49168 RepID=A0ACC0Q2M4_RHOML|nr:hypothetical protein RHMOL_Rhmol01G0095200 [Rhododendron molle]
METYRECWSRVASGAAEGWRWRRPCVAVEEERGLYRVETGAIYTAESSMDGQ